MQSDNEMYRIEHDTLGEVQIPKSALYGSYTARVVENFQISKRFIPEEFLKNYIGIKRVYANVNFKHEKLSKEKADAIMYACDMLLMMIGGEFMQHFPIDIYQSGGGTSTNMAVNEVIANIAEERLGGKRGEYKIIHPNDDVNMSQSSNDTFPAIIKITSYYQNEHLISQLEALRDALRERSERFLGILKVGRTHLQDAVTSDLGEEFKAFAVSVDKNITILRSHSKSLLELPLGGTAIGSLQNISEQLRVALLDELRTELQLNFTPPQSYYEAISSSSDIMRLSSTIRGCAVDMIKICNDIRLLASGPHAGLGELRLKANQMGSSIMPGKINPSIIEAAEMVCMSVIGLDETIKTATSQAQLQLQQFNPIIAWSIYDSLDLMRSATSMLTTHISEIEANKEMLDRNLKSSNAEATNYSEKLGYAKVSELVLIANKKGINPIELLEQEMKVLER